MQLGDLHIRADGLRTMRAVERKEEQGREIRAPVPGPPNCFMGRKITGTNGFAYFKTFPGKSYGPGGPRKSEKKALQPVLNFPEEYTTTRIRASEHKLQIAIFEF